jgi:hypothetical protein
VSGGGQACRRRAPTCLRGGPPFHVTSPCPWSCRRSACAPRPWTFLPVERASGAAAGGRCGWDVAFRALGVWAAASQPRLPGSEPAEVERVERRELRRRLSYGGDWEGELPAAQATFRAWAGAVPAGPVGRGATGVSCGRGRTCAGPPNLDEGADRTRPGTGPRRDPAAADTTGLAVGGCRHCSR